MAYPNPIPQTNLGVTRECLDWFKNALFNYIAHQDSEDYYDRWQQFIAALQALPALPITKQKYYELVRLYFPQINGAEIYTYTQTNSGWSIRMCNDWGKLKCIEQALFGETTATTGNSMASVNGTKFLQSITKWTSASMSFLRFGLCRFNTYGTGIVDQQRRPAPAINIVDVPNRTVSWHYAFGYSSPSDYEYMYPGYAWQTATSNPIVVPGNVELQVGDMLIRTRGDGGYIQYSESISNYAAIPLNASIVSILSANYQTFPESGFTVNFLINSPVGQDITILFSLSFETDFVQEPMLLGSGKILAGDTFGTGFIYYSTSSSPFNIEGKISRVTPNPSAGRWIIF